MWVCVVYVTAIIFTIVAIVLIVLAVKTPYRLGDFVAQNGGFDRLLSRSLYAKMQKKNSIVSQYHRRTHKAMNVPVLSHITRDPRKNLNDVLVVHLRLGDVIDNHKRSVEDFLSAKHTQLKKTNSMNGHIWQGSKCSTNDCSSEGYVKPLKYFEKKVHKIPKHVKQVLLVSGSHKKTKNPEKSQEYLQALQSFFEKHKYTVKIQWNSNVDADFKTLANAKYLITTGGNFSQLAAKVVKYNNCTVL